MYIFYTLLRQIENSKLKDSLATHLGKHSMLLVSKQGLRYERLNIYWVREEMPLVRNKI